MRVILIAVSASALGSCADAGSNDGGGGFCAALDASPGCTGELETCEDSIAGARGADPDCTAQLDSLEQCLAELDLSCDGGNDFDVSANGDGEEDASFAPTIGDYLLHIRDSACLDDGRAWENCRSCYAAVGFDSALGGVGDPCTDSGECASPLTCGSAGGCTQSCSADGECTPKHGYGECVTVNGRLGFCDNGTCATLCRGAGYTTYACPPS